MTLSTTLYELFETDLNHLKRELMLYKSEENLWKIGGEVNNSAGNLALHLVGNLNTYIGNELGKTGYVRDRPLEFSDKNVPREKILQMLDDTILMLKNTLFNLSEEDFAKQYTFYEAKPNNSTEYFMVHLLAHLGYHLGQITYHRRVFDV